MQVEASLGDAPTGDDLIQVLELFAELGAADHILRVFTKFAARLAPIASRWRESLPVFWQYGITANLRDLLSAHASSGGWELALALGELAILEKDFAGAEQHLWRVFAVEFGEATVSAHVPAFAARKSAGDGVIPLPGVALAHRLAELELHLERGTKVFAPEDETAMGWSILSTTDARDIAAVYLQIISNTTGGDAPVEFVAKLREHMADQKPDEALCRAVGVVGRADGLGDSFVFQNRLVDSDREGIAPNANIACDMNGGSDDFCRV